jgi:hypothetical protein
MSVAGQTLEVRYKPLRTVAVFVMSLAFVAMGIWLLGLDLAELSPRTARKYGWAMPWIPWVTIILFGVCAVAWARKIFDRRPQIAIGPGGIKLVARDMVEIPWSEILGAEVRSIARTKFLVLKLRDPALYPATGVAAKLAWLNRSTGYGDISIPMTGLDRSAREIFSAIRGFASRPQ